MSPSSNKSTVALRTNQYHDTELARNQSYVRAIPSRSGIAGFQPRARSLVTSKSLRGVPSGFVLSQASSPSNPTTSQINSASSRIEISSPQPTLMISGESRSEEHTSELQSP